MFIKMHLGKKAASLKQQEKINLLNNLFFYKEFIVLLHRNRLSDYLTSLTSTVQPLPSVLNSTSFLF